MNTKEMIAKKFGYYLDQDDFINFKSILEKDCVYEINDEILNNKDDIAFLYEKNMKEGKTKFDKLIWGESKVEKITENQFYVYFSDFLTHRGLTHNYKCKQKITVNSNNLIDKIVHIELPGERASLQDFYAHVGLK